jgi:aryl carrier-like protein
VLDIDALGDAAASGRPGVCISPDALASNAWGVTESPFFRPYFIDPRGPVPDGAVPAIGPPEEEAEIRLLDEDGHPVAPGETGEIIVTSRYLSPGYWGRDDLTRERFRTVEGTGERAYATGDLGRALPDGSIAHLGRKDFQTKVRGYRVEPAEVEGALRAVPGVRQAAVMGQADGQGGHRLIAYVVTTAAVGEVRKALRDRLPDYLVPSRFVAVPALPLTPSGKLDRLALPDPGRDRPALDRPFRAPATPLERALADIWGEVLDLDEIGVDDEFLELGGDSLLAMQVATRVREACGLDVPIQALFEAPTVAQMALTVVASAAGRAPGATAPFVGEAPAPGRGATPSPA